MASPTLETFCCVFERNNTLISALGFIHQQKLYNILSIVVSIIAIFGAIYQILPRYRPNSDHQTPSLHYERQRTIIKWLAVADLLAAFGLLMRSSVWLCDVGQGGREAMICAVTSGWVQYFYTVTYFWNLLFAVDIYSMLHHKNTLSLKCYHLIAWGLSAVISAIGLMTLHYPGFRCNHDIKRVLPNYVCSQGPLIIVMLCNPILYRLSSVKAKELIRGSGIYTCRERQTLSRSVGKFFAFVVIFYTCWITNVINSITVWSGWPTTPSYKEFLYTLWYIMAILNPLQAVLNAIVYRSKKETLLCMSGFGNQVRKFRLGFSDNESTTKEMLPLLPDAISNLRNSVNRAFTSSTPS